MNRDRKGLGSITFAGRPASPKPKFQAVDRTWKEDPTPAEPPMSREQRAAGLKDVNQRIWQHNHIEKPCILSRCLRMIHGERTFTSTLICSTVKSSNILISYRSNIRPQI